MEKLLESLQPSGCGDQQLWREIIFSLDERRPEGLMQQSSFNATAVAGRHATAIRRHWL